MSEDGIRQNTLETGGGGGGGSRNNVVVKIGMVGDAQVREIRRKGSGNCFVFVGFSVCESK